VSLAFLLPALLLVQVPEPAPKPVPKAGCVFCEIVAGTAPSKKVYENDRVLAFWDIKPRAKFHLLVIPKQHVSSMREMAQLPPETKAALLDACTKVAQDCGFKDEGFRVITNAGKDANQTVFHLHFHVVGGEKLPADAVRVKAEKTN
jgi:histidine triad (HIT) family protein